MTENKQVGRSMP